MHPLQNAILQLFENTQIIPFKLRWIAREVGESHPQKIKHHLIQLEKMGEIEIDLDNKEIKRRRDLKEETIFATLPIMGSANCGSATALAENRIEGFLKISQGFLPKRNTDQLFILKASGDSMNNLSDPKLKEQIEDGDYVIVEKTDYQPSDGDIVVSIIDGYANIKRFFHRGSKIALLSESKEDLPPIFIHEDDADKYQIAGKVVKIIKQPRFE